MPFGKPETLGRQVVTEPTLTLAESNRWLDTRGSARVKYEVMIVKDGDLGAQEWAVAERDDAIVLAFTSSGFCARVVAEGVAAVGSLCLRQAAASN